MRRKANCLVIMNKSLVDSIVDAVREASGLMVRSGFQVMQKDSLVNLVTTSDLAVQHYLVEKLGAILPGSGFLCEEEDLRELTHEDIWIVDPIDGTANYARGISDCAISVALVRKGVPEIGVVYSPWRNELYQAERGRGAFCNGHPIHVSGRPFRDGLLCTALSPYRKEYAKVCSDIAYDMFMQCNDTRRFGSAAVELCMMAAGIIDLYFEIRLSPWDYAAAMLILQEAGGTIIDGDGALPSLNSPSLVLAANSEENGRQLLDIVHRHI